MSRGATKEAFDFGGPATYRIVIQGMVSEDWHRRLGGMDVITSSPEPDEPRATLQGRLPDQAALHGLLDTLYALHLPILEVTKIEGSSDSDAAEGRGHGVPDEEAKLRSEK
jgi:hypothetical protein